MVSEQWGQADNEFGDLEPDDTRVGVVELLNDLADAHASWGATWENPDLRRYLDAAGAWLADVRGQAIVGRPVVDAAWPVVGRVLVPDRALARSSEATVPKFLRRLAVQLPLELETDELWLLSNAILAGVSYE